MILIDLKTDSSICEMAFCEFSNGLAADTFFSLLFWKYVNQLQLVGNLSQAVGDID